MLTREDKERICKELGIRMVGPDNPIYQQPPMIMFVNRPPESGREPPSRNATAVKKNAKGAKKDRRWTRIGTDERRRRVQVRKREAMSSR